MQMRLRALHSQLTAASNFCSTAKNAFVVGRLDLGRARVERARHTVQRVRAHLEEPNHIPADSVAGTRDRLVELESLISKLKSSPILLNRRHGRNLDPVLAALYGDESRAGHLELLEGNRFVFGARGPYGAAVARYVAAPGTPN